MDTSSQLQLRRELHDTRATLEAVERRARYLYDRSPVLCFILDGKGTIIDCNERALAALALPVDQVVGVPLADLCEEVDRPRLRERLLAMRPPAAPGEPPGVAVEERRSGAPRAIEVRLRTGRGVLDASATFSAMSARDGTPVEIHALLTDVSEVRFLERRMAQADRLASVGQLAAGVAHEINNPAAFVMANLSHLQSRLPLLCKLLRPSGLSGEAEDLRELRELLTDLPDLCEQSLHGMRRIRDIVRDLQVFARPADEQAEPVDLNALCDTVANMAFPQLRRHARLEKCYGDIPPVKAQPGKLSQVLMNLIINGVQAIPEGQQGRHKIVLTTATRGDGVAVSVSDTGAGIPQAVIGRIFDPFFTTKPVGKGTGLGLSVSYEIVRAQGGTIEVKSQVGAGSTFTVWLPAAQPGAGRAAAEPAKAPVPPAGLHGKLLLVDDEPEILRAMSRMLRPAHQVLLAATVREALKLLLAHGDIDVILCDLMMPDQSGMDLYEALSPELRQRCLFLSGDTGSRAVRTFLESSGAQHLTKPVETAVLRQSIDAAIRRRRGI